MNSEETKVLMTVLYIELAVVDLSGEVARSCQQQYLEENE